MHSIVRQGARVGAAAALMLTGMAGASTLHQVHAQPKAAAAANVDWPMFGNTSDNTRFSTLTQINANNVTKLGIAWTQQEGPNLSVFETDPVVVNGVMYFTTNTDQVRAVNAATGKLIWQYTPKVNFALAISGGGGGVATNRGVTVANSRVYLLTFDDQFLALQASTGEKLWSAQVSDPAAGYSETSPATYWNGLLLVGGAESDAGERGFVAAYNASTGKQVWRYYTVPAPGHGWNQPAKAKHGGGDVWMPSVIDNTTGILYFGTGNPSPDLDNSQRPGCNPWVDATVALDARTGKFLWAHTEVCPDLWDYDSHQPPMLFNLTIHGQVVRAVGHGNKSGFYFIYNAKTGKLIAKSPPLGKWSVPHLAPTRKGVIVCPTASGGIEYSPPAFSPLTQFAYEPGLNTCGIFKLSPVSQTNLHAQGAPDFGGVPIPYGKTTGFMAAVDAATGKIAWRTQVPNEMVGGALATAGNLVFSGCDDGNVYAFDAKTGKVLWKGDVGLSIGAAPLTYEVNGTQYIAIAVGGSVVTTGKVGGTLVVFKLNGSPVHHVPAIVTPQTVGVGAAISVAGLTQISPGVYVNAARQHVVFKIVAAATADNSGFNFNGYSRGKANFVVPAGWSVDWIFTNKAALPHSVALTASPKPGAAALVFGFYPVSTANAAAGIKPGTTQYVGFPANQPGKYYLVCLVPGHIAAGMWDYFTVSSTAKMPSITTQ